MREFILNLDRPRRLKFGFRANRLIREKLKINITNPAELLEKSLDEMVPIIWAGLVWEDEGLTPEKVEQLVDEKIGDTYSQADVLVIAFEAYAEHVGAEKKTTGQTSTEQEKPPSESGSATPSLKT